MSGSCFAARLRHFLPLTEAEEGALARLEENERPFRRGETIRQQGDPARDLFIVRSGWLYSHIALEGGRRQILRLEFPGDLAGTSSVAFGSAADSLTAVSNGVLCPMERGALAQLFIEHGRLAALLFVITEAERVSLNDRLASIGRTSAKARVAALLVDVLVRHRIMNGATGDAIEVPLTQEEIGDATGLTSVHVNRMLRALVEEGFITRTGARVTILNETGLFETAEYLNRYDEVDTSWLPPPEA